MTVATIETSEGLIAWRYLWWALTAIAVMIAAIVAGNLWLLNFIHVFSSLLWTGIDLFMGFVLGPILRQVDLSVRREIVRRLTPRTLFLMPTVSIISGTRVGSSQSTSATPRWHGRLMVGWRQHWCWSR
jgi:hypothetical protein